MASPYSSDTPKSADSAALASSVELGYKHGTAESQKEGTPRHHYSSSNRPIHNTAASAVSKHLHDSQSAGPSDDRSDSHTMTVDSIDVQIEQLKHEQGLALQRTVHDDVQGHAWLDGEHGTEMEGPPGVPSAHGLQPLESMLCAGHPSVLHTAFQHGPTLDTSPSDNEDHEHRPQTSRKHTSPVKDANFEKTGSESPRIGTRLTAGSQASEETKGQEMNTQGGAHVQLSQASNLAAHQSVVTSEVQPYQSTGSLVDHNDVMLQSKPLLHDRASPGEDACDTTPASMKVQRVSHQEPAEISGMHTPTQQRSSAVSKVEAEEVNSAHRSNTETLDAASAPKPAASTSISELPVASRRGQPALLTTPSGRALLEHVGSDMTISHLLQLMCVPRPAKLYPMNTQVTAPKTSPATWLQCFAFMQPADMGESHPVQGLTALNAVGSPCLVSVNVDAIGGSAVLSISWDSGAVAQREKTVQIANFTHGHDVSKRPSWILNVRGTNGSSYPLSLLSGQDHAHMVLALNAVLYLQQYNATEAAPMNLSAVPAPHLPWSNTSRR